MSLPDHAQAFVRLKASRNLSKSAIRLYTYSLKIFCAVMEKHFQVTNPQALGVNEIRAFVSYITRLRSKTNPEKRIREATIQNHLLAAREFLKYLVNTDLLEQDLSFCLFRRWKEKKLPRSILTESQIEKIFSLPDQFTFTGYRDLVILETLYNTGLRAGELTGLELADINFDEQTVFIRQGKGGKDRVVPMGAYLEKYLREYIAKVRPALAGTNYAEQALFLDTKQHKLSKATLSRLIRAYSLQGGIAFSAHTLRHSFATHLLKGGASALYIQRLLGHESLTTTGVYTRVYPGDLKEIILRQHPRAGRGLARRKISLPTGKQVPRMKKFLLPPKPQTQ